MTKFIDLEIHHWYTTKMDFNTHEGHPNYAYWIEKKLESPTSSLSYYLLHFESGEVSHIYLPIPLYFHELEFWSIHDLFCSKLPTKPEKKSIWEWVRV